ncbi:hypothetical protein F5Y17DRAFT_423408 [Xylariaceae sp. FL0594]|nr:hypothetical protein F5Y17DRAFT_423408 [Xylariaceae sp. FL0594]
MGAAAGFDIVPRLAGVVDDWKKWDEFILSVEHHYANDEQVVRHEHCIEFKAGEEHPLLPLFGSGFLRFFGVEATGSDAETSRVVRDYIQRVTGFARKAFGSRIRPWNELCGDVGFYNWDDVRDSMRAYNEGTAHLDVPVNRFRPSPRNKKMYEALIIPGKGRGLVATRNIKSGTRIICEQPLFRIINKEDVASLDKLVAAKVESLSEEDQREFLTMRINIPGKHGFARIFMSTSFPCGAGAPISGIFLECYLLNHSCLPNCTHQWNANIGRMTVHAMKDILVGDELTRCYAGGLYEERQRKLSQYDYGGFTCRCELCGIPPDLLRVSDDRRRRIKEIVIALNSAEEALMSEPAGNLHACEALLNLLVEEYGTSDHYLVEQAYYLACDIVISHADQARAVVFLERCYMVRVACWGDDNWQTQHCKWLMEEPDMHPMFAAASTEWMSSKTAQPQNLNHVAFEDWLWRR